MRRIAVWGFGAYGRHMVRTVDTQWDDTLSITRIYDLNFSGLTGLDPRLADPATVQEDYRDGMFDAVMIAVNLEQYYRQIRDRLDACQIPVFELGKPEDFVSGHAFAQVENPATTISHDGYDFFVLRDLLGAVSPAPSNGIMYLFDRSGRMLAEHWDAYWVKDNFTHQFDYPVRPDAPHDDAVAMPGAYCILAKLWSFNYSHFTFESMDCVQLLEESGFTGRYVISPRSYNKELMLLYGIDQERILTLTDFEIGTTYAFEEVCFPKLIDNERRYSAPVLKRFSEHMMAGLERDPGAYPSRLYVERSGSRKLRNSAALVEPYGFATINPDDLSVHDQMNYFYNADIVLCPHGANATNSLYMRPGTVLIETFGRNWVKYSYFNALNEKGVFHLPLVEGPIMPSLPASVSVNPSADYTIAPERLRHAMEIALRLRGDQK